MKVRNNVALDSLSKILFFSFLRHFFSTRGIWVSFPLVKLFINPFNTLALKRFFINEHQSFLTLKLNLFTAKP